jgi:hypothetical protein
VAAESAAAWKAWPPALRASVAFGIVGAIVLIFGLLSGATPVLVVATTAGSLSLVCALIWRAQLIEAWRKEHGRPTRDW